MKDLGPGEVFSLSLSLSYGTTFFFLKKFHVTLHRVMLANEFFFMVIGFLLCYFWLRNVIFYLAHLSCVQNE